VVSGSLIATPAYSFGDSLADAAKGTFIPLADEPAENPEPLPDAERERLTRGLDEQEQAMLHAIGRREALISKQVKKGEASVRE